MQNVVDKARSTGNDDIMVCERGFSFGYNNLVSDMRSLAVMRGTGCPVVFDATHSVQLPGGKGTASGGQREFIPVLARAATAAGVAGLFMETHPDPANALSDGPNAWPLDKMQALLETLQSRSTVVKNSDYLEADTARHLTHAPPVNRRTTFERRQAISMAREDGVSMIKITEIHGREILDSRGNPTVEAEVTLADGIVRARRGSVRRIDRHTRSG